MKSPIKDSINQFKCATFLKKIIPEGSVVHSFLFYAGDLEFTLAESQRFVCAHTIKPFNIPRLYFRKREHVSDSSGNMAYL